MGISQYDQPGRHEFINSYVPIPFQEMAGALQARQRSYADTATRRDATFNALKDQPAHRFDEPAYQEMMGGLDKELYEFNKEHPDLSSLEAKTGLNKILQSTTRNKFLRDISANLPVLQQMEKDLAIANAEQRPWDAMNIQASLDQYQQVGGAMGVGQIAPQGLADATDVNPLLERIGASFVKEGGSRTWNDELARYTIKRGSVGVSPHEVAAAYGMSIDGDQLSLDYIPTKIATSPDFTTMRNMAAYASQNNPEISYQDALEQLYYESVAPMIDKYSGYNTTFSDTLTSKGFSDMEREALSIDFMQHVGRVTGVHDMDVSGLGKASKVFGMLNDLFLASGNPLAMTVGGVNKLATDMLGGSVDEAREAGVSKEQYVAGIDERLQTAMNDLPNKLIELGLPEEYATPFMAKASPFAVGLRVAASMQKVAGELNYDKFAPKQPSQDYISLIQPELDKGGYSSDDWFNLTDEEQQKLHPIAKKNYKTWSKSGVNVGVRQVDPKTQQEMATMLLGQNSDNGRVTGATLGGIASYLLTWDPKHPDDKFLLGDKVKEKDVISFIGFPSSDNVYGGGLVSYSINGKPYWQQVPGMNATPGHPMHGRDAQSQAVPNLLTDYNKHPGTEHGDWFNVGEYSLRSVVDEHTPTGEAKSVHIEFAPRREEGELGRWALSDSKSTISIVADQTGSVAEKIQDLYSSFMREEPLGSGNYVFDPKGE